MNKNKLRKIFTLAGFAVVLLLFPRLINNDMFVLNMVIMTGIYIILTVSLRILFMTGIWHVGQAAFYAIGAYALIFFTKPVGLSFWASLPLAGIAATIVALAIGPLTLRVKGVYFCILSIAFVEVIRLTFMYSQSAENRILRALPPDPISFGSLFTIDFTTNRAFYYYLILGVAAITLLILYRIENSRLGRILKSIEKSELLAKSIGIDTIWYKVAAFCICSFFAGIAGALFASYNVVVSETSFTIWLSMTFIVQMVVGGMGSFWGPVLGTTLLTIVPEYLPTDPIFDKIIYGCLLIIILTFLPKGLIALPSVVHERISSLLGKKRSKRLS